MSYIDLINAFGEWLETNHLENDAQLLWYKLIALFNKAKWREWIQVDNQTLMAKLHINRTATFIKYRNDLIENKFFYFKKGKKGFPNQYKICTYNFETINSNKNSSINSSTNSSQKRSRNRRHI